MKNKKQKGKQPCLVSKFKALSHGSDDILCLAAAVKDIDVPCVQLVLSNIPDHLSVFWVPATSGKRNGRHDVHTDWLV